MNIVFAGTPEFAAAHLQALLNTAQSVRAVFTQPDRPAGRGRKLQSSPVKRLALDHGLQVFQPASLRDASVQASLAELSPDLMVVVAYGLLLPEPVLALPRLGCLNVHASLLPRWRGASPIIRAIWAGDAETGISVMQMDEGLDTGPILRIARCAIEPHDTAQSLHDRLAALGADTLLECLRDLEGDGQEPWVQDDSLATYAKKVERAEARLDWSRPALELDRWVRAFNPWPVAWTTHGEQQWRVWEAAAIPATHPALPGQVVAASAEGIDVATTDGQLRIRRLQLPGGRPITAKDYLNARPSPIGERLGQ